MAKLHKLQREREQRGKVSRCLYTHTHRIAHRLRAKIQQSSSIERKEMCLWSEIKKEAVKEGKGALRQQGHSYRHTAHTLTFSLIGTESSTC